MSLHVSIDGKEIKPRAKAKIIVEYDNTLYELELDTFDLNISQGVREIPSDGPFRSFLPTEDVTTTFTGKGHKMPTVRAKPRTTITGIVKLGNMTYKVAGDVTDETV
jgi:hypothetical protein